jgi:V8-like Glu-specific endopeptidase
MSTQLDRPSERGSPFEAGTAATPGLRQALAAGERFRGRARERERRETLRREGLWLQSDSRERVVERFARLAATTAPPGAAVPKRDVVERRVIENLERPAPSRAVFVERILGRSDLLPVAYFARGDRAARSVGRIVIRSAAGVEEGYGTGFLVSPTLLLTNHHVLPAAEVAAQSVVQFDYEKDAVGGRKPAHVCPLDPRRCYVSDEALDFALVGVTLPDGAARQLGWNPLRAHGGKAAVGDSVSIVQHPGGDFKQVAVRDNRLIDALDDFYHYTTDTAPGASGSPVFNDQWEVVALHHSGVPELGADCRPVAANGGPWTPAMGDAAIRWIANEGVRVSRVIAFLQGADLPAHVRPLINDMLSMEPPMTPTPTSTLLPPSTPSPVAAPASLLLPTNGAGQPEDTAPTARRRVDLSGGSGARPADEPVTLSVPIGAPVEVTVRVARGPAVDAPRGDEGLWSTIKDKAGDVVDVVKDKAGDVVDAIKDKVVDVVSDLIPGGGPPPKLPAAALQPGDVLLYQGKGIISQGIMFFTNSDVSHAGLFLGNGMVGEAVADGLMRRSKKDSFSGAAWVIARRLPTRPPTQPVLARANGYLDQRLKYGYQQIVLLAILLVIKRVRPSGVLGKLIQTAAAAAAAALNEFLGGGKDLMICSEFVYRAYDEASNASPDPYRLTVPGIATREAAGAGAPGTGVEPGSVLDNLARHPEILRGATALAAENLRTLAVSALPQETLIAQVEQLLEEHMAEVRYGRPARTMLEAFESGVTDEQIAASVATLALALEAVHRAPAGGTRESVVAAVAEADAFSEGVPASLQRLFRTAADFVTPADLRKSTSLVDVARAW